MTEEYVPGTPPQIPTKLKAWVGFFIAIVMSNAAVVVTAMSDNVVSNSEWWGIGIAVVGSIGTGLGVWAAPRYAKSN